MGIIKKIIGPKSKYDKSLPYAYIAKVPIIAGGEDESMIHYYFADTICALVEFLDKNNINPDDTELFGCYHKEEIHLDKKYCMSEDGKWLKRPEICHSLETHYLTTMEEQYRGHIELGECSFDDRERQGSGPF
jgi:hypothetical protein